VNAWLWAALVLLVGALTPCLVVTFRGSPMERLTGMTLAATVLTVLFLLLSQGFSRTSYQDLALVLAVLAPTGTLVFTRLLSPASSGEGGDGDGGDAPSAAEKGGEST